MSVIGKSMLLVFACSCSDGWRDETLVACGQSVTHTAQQRLESIDRDGDGALTADDLEPGRAGAVLSWLGAGARGTSVHLSPASDQPAVSSSQNHDWEPTWAVQSGLDGCEYSAIAGLGFKQEDPNLSYLVPGVAELLGAFVAVPDLEIVPARAEESNRPEGRVWLSEVGETVSGHLEGAAEVDLTKLGAMTDTETGQTVRVEAFAFRDLPVY